jgi:hypothetical protein
MPRDSSPFSTPFTSAATGAAGLSYSEFTDSSREALATMMSSGAVLGAGLEAIGQEVAQYARTAFTSAGETAGSLLGARTFEDVVRLQTEYAKRSFAGLVAGSVKLSELSCALFGAGVGAWAERMKR